MIQTAGRLTLYGLISSLDVDLRGLVRDEVILNSSIEQALTSDQLQKVKERAQKDGVTDSSLYYEYLDFDDSLAILRRNTSLVSTAVNKLIKRQGAHFDKLLPVRNRIMHARPILLTDYPLAEAVAKIVREAPPAFFAGTREFDARVRRDPHHVFSLDMSAVSRDSDRIANNLPLPEYDETGFVGRDNEKQELKRLCESQWPVITVVGEGGYGKTALTLQVAYDILDDEGSSWDAIVWTTAKRIRLTLNDIETIEGAITSSLGIIQAAAAQLGGEAARPRAVQEVVNYLNSFKVLLIIDNLETILDPVLVDFLRQLNGRSKVLTTSRVGVGELSYSYPLDKMDLREATRLLRNTARARQVVDLATAKAATLEGFCQKMKLNAGFIKWFVTCVQYGKRPEETLANPKVFLDFCVSYVYEHVSEDAKLVTKAMLAAPGKQSLPLISYLTGLSGDRLEMALLSLQSANILKMSTTFLEEGSETVYELSELPRLYILKNHPPAPAEDAEFKRKKREVVALFDKLQVESGINKYSPRAIACRTPSDSVSAKLLMEALDLSRKERFEDALEAVKQAAALDPSFHEVYRVEAYIYYWSGNYIAAEEAYEAAVAYEPKSAPLRFWYGGFLLRGIHDPKRARDQFDIARQLDSTNLRILIELARCDLHLGQYEHARQGLEEVLAKDDVPLKDRRISYDSYLQVLIRTAQRALAHGDYGGGLRLMREMVESLSERPVEWRDGRILITVAQAVPLISQLAAKCGSEKSHVEGVQLVNAIQALRGSNALSPLEGEAEEAAVALPSPPLAEGQAKLHGHVTRILHERRFGFIRPDSGEDIFFHFSQVADLDKIFLGAAVSFRIGAAADGRSVAVSVRGKAYPPRPPIMEGTRFLGTVKKKMATFGFIFCEDGHDYFFHTTNLCPTLSFNALKVGARVAFVAQATERGTVATEIILAED